MCKSKSTTHLHFLKEGRVLKFGLRDITLITGLNCSKVPELNTKDINGGGRLKMIYFETLKSVTRHYLNTMFKISMAGTDKDRIQMAKLYFLESFLLPRQESLSIEWDYVLMVDDDELFGSYPWRRVAFDLLLEFMNRVVCNK